MRVSAAGLILIAAAAAALSANAQTIVVIRVKSIQTSSIDHDKAPKGFSVGDVIVERDRLVNVRSQFGRPADAAVGSDVGTLTRLSPTRGVVAGTTTLP